MPPLSPDPNEGQTITDLQEKVNRAVIKAAEEDISRERLRCARLVVDSCREASYDFSRLYGTVVSHELLKLGAEIYKKIVTAPLFPEEPPSHVKNS